MACLLWENSLELDQRQKKWSRSVADVNISQRMWRQSCVGVVYEPSHTPEFIMKLVVLPDTLSLDYGENIIEWASRISSRYSLAIRQDTFYNRRKMIVFDSLEHTFSRWIILASRERLHKRSKEAAKKEKRRAHLGCEDVGYYCSFRFEVTRDSSLEPQTTCKMEFEKFFARHSRSRFCVFYVRLYENQKIIYSTDGIGRGRGKRTSLPDPLESIIYLFSENLFPEIIFHVSSVHFHVCKRPATTLHDSMLGSL